jgi:hypothetical protein
MARAEAGRAIATAGACMLVLDAKAVVGWAYLRRCFLVVLFFFAIANIVPYRVCDHASVAAVYTPSYTTSAQVIIGGATNLLIYVMLIAAIAAIGISAMCLRQLKRLELRFEAALGGNETDSLEHTLSEHLARVKAVDARLIELNAEYERLAVTNSLASQKISIVRFNPFGDTGGDQSFSLAVLDAHDSGYVLTSIHGRQGTRVYVKPVDFAQSKYSLSTEEQQALGQAIKRVPQIKE